MVMLQCLTDRLFEGYRRDDLKRARSKMWVEADLEKSDLAGQWLAKILSGIVSHCMRASTRPGESSTLTPATRQPGLESEQADPACLIRRSSGAGAR